MYTIYETPVSLIWNYDDDESSSDLGTSSVLRLVTAGNLPTVNHYGHDKARDHHQSKDLSLIHLDVL